ncbi:MAG: protein kinase [Gemmatimonadaceae bacterium]|nr:protein kinase [Gemmatimonadaceae bacterium]
MAKICPVCGTEFTDESAFCPADGSTLRSKENEAGDLVGQVIADRYLVQKKLGEGGMGAVYLAKHVRLPKQAAIKVLRPEMLADSASVARFNQEAANASQIEHEGVARVFDYGETADGTVYLAMEFVKGRSLRDVLDQDGALSLEKTAAIVRQVAGGLDAAHRLGIVHRDLKPDNILVAEEDGTGEVRCKVVDFGIAKAVGAGANGQALTRTGMVVGTPEFMSPEQLLAGELDHRSDVYALALVAYQCLTLDLPFDLKAPDRGMTARLVSQPRGLAVVRPDLPWPKELQAVFDQGLDRDPDQRTPSAGAFADAFDDAVAVALGGKQSAKPAKSATATAKAAAAAAASAPTIAAPAPSTAKAVEKSGGNGALIGIAAAVIILGGGGAWWFMGRGAAAAPTADSTAVASAAPATGGEAPAAGPAPATPTTPGGGAGAAGTGATAKPGAATTAPATTTPAAGTKPGTAPAAGPAPGGSAPAAPELPAEAGSNAAALRSLDNLEKTVRRAMEADNGNDLASAAIPELRRLLPQLTTSTDSANAYLRIAEAYGVLDDAKSACLSLQLARRTARTSAQAGAITRMTELLSCK